MRKHNHILEFGIVNPIPSTHKIDALVWEEFLWRHLQAFVLQDNI
jgi:hypothetical protein